VNQSHKANKKTKIGVVVSNKMTKTVVVQVERKVRHPLYQKVMSISKKFKAHDEESLCKEGDKVRIMETRPMSKDKRWVVMEVIGRKKDLIENDDKGMPAPIRRAAVADKEKSLDTN
jgi:small subunit ribosomal protein S17